MSRALPLAARLAMPPIGSVPLVSATVIQPDERLHRICAKAGPLTAEERDYLNQREGEAQC